MSRLGGWFRANVKSDTKGDAAVAAVERERNDCLEAMGQAQLIMNDDVDGAYASLRKGNSSFHRLGAAVAYFMRSVLGMERQVMAQATELLNDCEARAWEDARAAERRGPRGDSVYPPGIEYELVRAETQLMGAVVGVLHESLVEAMKSFYKLRKAFITLDGIIAVEARLLGEAVVSAAATNGRDSHAPSINGDGSGTSEASSESGVFVDAKEVPSGTQTPLEEQKQSNGVSQNGTASEAQQGPSTQMPQRELVFTDPVDVFIHSGANMCFGILMLILTLVPPSFARILSVVGFRGDRDRGVRMLWRSSVNDNINGAVAGMTLLAYYNGILGTVDILPSERDYDEAAETVGPPHEKCAALLATMRERYPDSRLWQVEESRRLSGDRNLRGAIDLLTTGEPSKMKQVMALNDFELALDALFIQDWPLTRDTFLRCAETNEWSPSLYYFMAGCATIELYRDAVQAGDETEARKQKKTAEAYLRKAPTMTGKKRFMAGKLPFDVFLERKVQRWEARATELGVDLADAIGVSPVMDVSYMWNGSKRMNDEELDRSIETIAWERCTCNEDTLQKIKSEEDEMGLWAVCMSATLRRRGTCEDARRLLEEYVLPYDRAVFKGAVKNDYVLPAATYELAAIAWEECCVGRDTGDELAYRKEKLDECEMQLDKVKNWESYTLDMRIGLKVQSGLETLKWFKNKMKWS